MKAIILAAWEWTRLRPFTNTIPKPLLKICGKFIIEHNLEYIYDKVDEIIIVVKYKKELFYEKLWDNFKWTKITFFEQNDEIWTAAAIRWIDIWNSDILLLNWDSIFEKIDFDSISSLDWYWCLVQKVEDPSKYGIFIEENNIAKKVVEKPLDFIWNLASVWVYKFGKEIIDLAEKVELSSRWEYEITDAINTFIEMSKFKLLPISGNFIDVWYPWDILTANSYFLDKLEDSKLEWIVEENVVIKWNIVLEKWAILKSGTYIEWNCYIWKETIIWPNIYLRWNTVIWDNCHIWANNEIKNSSIWDYTNIAHLSYIWDSIIWNNVNIGWGFISANLRHDKANIKVAIKWVLTDTGKYKLWVMIWDNCKTGINSSSMPWRIMQNDTFSNPGEIIK